MNKTTTYKVIGLLFVVLLMSPMVVSIFFANKKVNTKEPQIISEIQMINDVKKAEEERIFQKVRTALTEVKQLTRDPTSVVWEDVFGEADASIICVQLSARNGFNGMSREYITVVKGQITSNHKQWNKDCANRALKDWKIATYKI